MNRNENIRAVESSMPVVTIESNKSVQIDDDLTDLSWLIQMNNNKQRYSTTNEYNYDHQKTKKLERINKPFAVVNGQTIRSSLPTFTNDHQYSNEENQFYSHQSLNRQPLKRKLDSSYHHHQTKRFHSEQMLPIYPTPSDSFYYDHPPEHRTSMPMASRYMLLKNDPSLSDTLPIVRMPTKLNEPIIQMIEHENIYSDDIEHLLDIFKNEVEMIGLDPIASTSAGDCTIDMGHCLSANEFCSY